MTTTTTMSDPARPRPCLYCRNAAPAVRTTPLGYAVCCSACKARGPVRSSRAGAVGAWDGRGEGEGRAGPETTAAPPAMPPGTAHQIGRK